MFFKFVEQIGCGHMVTFVLQICGKIIWDKQSFASQKLQIGCKYMVTFVFQICGTIVWDKQSFAGQKIQIGCEHMVTFVLQICGTNFEKWKASLVKNYR